MATVVSSEPPAPPTKPRPPVQLGTLGGVPVYRGALPRGGRSDPSLFVGKGLEPGQRARVTGTYRLEGGGFVVVGAGAGDGLVPGVGLDRIPLSGAVDAAQPGDVVEVEVQVGVETVDGRTRVRFDPVGGTVRRAVRGPRKVARAFHRRHRSALRTLVQDSAGAGLPPLDSGAELTPVYDGRAQRLAFSASAARALDMAWSVDYEVDPNDRVVAVYVSTMYLGE